MTDDCVTCGALWNRTSLSQIRPTCDCDERICYKCDSVRCADCEKLLHRKCAVPYAEDLYCDRCAQRKLKQDAVEVDAALLRSLSLEERLAASIAIAEMRRTG